ncbi:BrnA antitoxin family protein, partial [Patescibacteria group bacterium]|nr:BrnA antitoxin family protein [Patescibacteria group bacterium]
MSQNLKPIPQFKNEDEERNFWATADTSEYFAFEKSKY